MVEADRTAGNLRACVFFTDGGGTAEGGDATSAVTRASTATICTAALSVTGGNNAPTGRVVIQLYDEDEAHISDNYTTTPVTMLAVGKTYSIGVSTGGGNLMDADSTATIVRSIGSGTDSIPSAPSGPPAAFADSGEGISWQYSAAQSGPWTEDAFGSDADGSAAADYVPSDDARAAGWVRVCLFYTDPAGNAEGGDSSSATTRAMATSENTCSVAVATRAMTNTAAMAGAITAADGTDLSTTGPNEDNELTIANPTDADGVPTDSSAFTWQWSASAMSGGTYTAITGNGADTAAFTPQQAHVGMFLQACVTFDDNAGNTETDICAQLAHAVVNVNDAPTGDIFLVNTNSRGAVVTSATEDKEMFTAITSTGRALYGTEVTDGRLKDADGFAFGGNGRDNNLHTISWQRGTTVSSTTTWAEILWGPDTTADDNWGIPYTPVDADVGSNIQIRSCIFYVDAQGTLEGSPTDTDAAIADVDESERTRGTICTTGIPVNGINDDPGGMPAVTYDGVITVPTEESPITANQGDIADPDGLPRPIHRHLAMERIGTHQRRHLQQTSPATARTVPHSPRSRRKWGSSCRSAQPLRMARAQWRLSATA